MNSTDLAKSIGQRALFLGVDTASWNLAQFEAAAEFAAAHHIDTLFIKTADGGNRWYQWYGDNTQGWQAIRQACLKKGVGAIAYTYSYGNKFGALATEIALLQEYMREDGVVIADMEEEWNSHADWASTLCAAMKAVPGIFLVSTWANPDDQNWQGVIQALNPCVDAYLPQQYTNYLASCWPQFGALGAQYIMPTFMIGQDFGPNDAVANARAAHSQGHIAMSVWYYGPAVSNPALLDQILAAFPATSLPSSTTTSQPQEENMLQLTDPLGLFFSLVKPGIWICKSNKIEVKGAILEYFLRTDGAVRLPKTVEQYNIPSVVWQRFESGIIVYDPHDKIDTSPASRNHTYLLKLDSDEAKQILGITALQQQITNLQQQLTKTDIPALKQQLATAQAQLSAALAKITHAKADLA